VEVVASLSQGRTAAAQCGLFTHKSVPVVFEPPCNFIINVPQYSVPSVTEQFCTYYQLLPTGMRVWSVIG